MQNYAPRDLYGKVFKCKEYTDEAGNVYEMHKHMTTNEPIFKFESPKKVILGQGYASYEYLNGQHYIDGRNREIEMMQDSNRYGGGFVPLRC